MRPSLHTLSWILALWLGCTASAAHAQSRNGGQMELAVAITNGCTLTTRDVRFPLVVGVSGSVRAVGGVDVQCTTNLPFTIKMDRGRNALGINRRMRNPTTGAFVRYDLYSNPGYTTRWTDQNAGKVTGNSGTTGNVSYPVYGEMIYDGATVPGRYEDFVTVTIEF